MKKTGVCTVLTISAICFLAFFSPMRASADTVNLTFENVGPGNNSGGVYTFPYNFSIDGSKQDVSLMCYSFLDEIYLGESWTATVEPITTQPEEELAYLFSIANSSSSSPNAVAAAQWAAWVLFDSGAASNVPSQFTSAVTADLTAAKNSLTTEPASFYTGFELFVPVSGSQKPSDDGYPQSFIGTAVTPEPRSILLLGTGLLFMAGMAFRRKPAPPGRVA